jgi:MFS transporter, DHA1 family, multidrug resistance protein
LINLQNYGLKIFEKSIINITYKGESIIKTPPSIWSLAAVTGLAPLTLNLIVPSLPSLSIHFEISYASAQIAISSFIISMAIGQIFIGPLSDAYGRRSILMYGIIIFLIGTLICSFSTTIEMLIVGRFIQAFGGVAGVVLGRAIIRDVYSREKSASALGYVTSVMVIAPMIAPPVGGFLEDTFGWTSIFYLMFFVGLILLINIFLNLAETKTDDRIKGDIKSLMSAFKDLLRLPKFIFYTLTMSCSNSMFFTFLGVAPFLIIQELNFTPTQYGFTFMLISFAFMAGSFTTARLSERFGSLRMISYAVFGTIFGSILMLVIFLYGVVNIYIIFGVMMIITYSNGIVIPNIIANIVSIRPKLAGSASGLSGCIQYTLAAISSYVAALLATMGILYMPMQLIILAIVGTCSFYFAEAIKDS